MKKGTLLAFLLILLSLQNLQANDEKYFFWKSVFPQFDSISKELEVSSLRGHKADLLLMGLEEIEKEINLPVIKSRALFWKACIDDSKELVDKDYIIEQLELALSYNDSTIYPYDYARIRYQINAINLDYLKVGYQDSFRQFILASKIFEEFKDYKYLGLSKVSLALILREIGEYESALDYYLEADSLFDISHEYQFASNNKINIANLYYLKGRNEESIDLLEKYVPNYIAENDTSLVINSYMSLYIYHTDINEKRKYVYKAYKLAQLAGHEQLKMSASFNLCHSLLEKGDFDSTYIIAKSINRYSKINNNHLFLYKSNVLLSKVYAQRRQMDSAYLLSSQGFELYEDLISVENVAKINTIQARVAIDKIKDKMIISDLEAQKERRHKQFILIFSGFIILFFFMMFRTFRKQSIAKTRIKELENIQLASKLSDEELQNEKYALEIDLKNRELSSTTLVLTEKNGILKNILKVIEDYNLKGTMSDKQYSPLKSLINDSLQSEDEWEMFKIHFEKVHPDFFFTLKNKYPTLTETELKYCAYIRIGMSAKQIALMLSVRPSTVIKSRYRVRKKFNLLNEESLDELLRQI